MLSRLAHAYLRQQHQRSMLADQDPVRAQARLLDGIASATDGTEVRALQSREVFQSLELFRKNARITRYADYKPLIDRALSTGCPHIFERRTTRAFAHSSSNERLVPFTKSQVSSFRRYQTDVLAQALVGRTVKGVLSERTLILQGAWNVSVEDNITTGYSSAVMMQLSSWLLRRKLLPSLDALRERDLERRLALTRSALLEQRPRQVSGMPGHVASIIEALLAQPHADEVREVLREVRFYAWGGEGMGTHERIIRSTLAPDCVYVDALSATEGAMGLPAETQGLYRPAVEHSLLMFVSVDNPGERFFSWELQRDATYEVLVTTHAGLTAYGTGDTIRVVQSAPLRFVHVPRAREASTACTILKNVASNFVLYRSEEPGASALLLEADKVPSEGILAALRASLSVNTLTVKRLAPGTLSRAYLQLQNSFAIKVPRLIEDKALFDQLLRHTSFAPSNREESREAA